MKPTWRGRYTRYKTYFLNVASQYKKKKDLKMYLEILLTLAAISILSIFALKPTLITIAELVAQIKAKKQTINVLDEKTQSLNKAQVFFDQEAGRISLLETSVPKKPAPDSFISQVQGITNKYTVTVVSISLNKVVLSGQAESSGELSFSIITTGNYPSLSSFISSMESLRRPVKIDSLNITSSETKEGKILILVVNGRTPYLRI